MKRMRRLRVFAMDGSKHVANSVPKTNLVDPEILNLFWILAEVDDTKRLDATKNLLKRISDKQSPLEKVKLYKYDVPLVSVLFTEALTPWALIADCAFYIASTQLKINMWSR